MSCQAEVCSPLRHPWSLADLRGTGRGGVRLGCQGATVSHPLCPRQWLEPATWPTPLPQPLPFILTSRPAFLLQELILGHFPFWIFEQLTTPISTPLPLTVPLFFLASRWLSHSSFSAVWAQVAQWDIPKLALLCLKQTGCLVPGTWTPLWVPKLWDTGVVEMPPASVHASIRLSTELCGVLWRSLGRAQTAPPCCGPGGTTCPHGHLPTDGEMPALCCHSPARAKVSFCFPPRPRRGH